MSHSCSIVTCSAWTNYMSDSVAGGSVVRMKTVHLFCAIILISTNRTWICKTHTHSHAQTSLSHLLVSLVTLPYIESFTAGDFHSSSSPFLITSYVFKLKRSSFKAIQPTLSDVLFVSSPPSLKVCDLKVWNYSPIFLSLKNLTIKGKGLSHS